jgi:arylsulfatase A-like enzyme
MCEWFDETCGELLDYLDEKDVRENTLVFYLCDNGWAAPSTNRKDPNQKLWSQYAQRSKSSPYENGIRTPIMISWPGKVRPERSPDFAQSIDFFPTVAVAAGQKVPDGLPGIDLLDAKARGEREMIFGVCNSTHNMSPDKPDGTLQYLWGIEGDWKLIVRYPGSDTTQYKNLHVWDTAPVRLYNLKEDPQEKQELAAKHPEIVAAMRKKIEAWHPVTGL